MLEALTRLPYTYSNFMKYYSNQRPFKEEEIDPEKLINLPVATQHTPTSGCSAEKIKPWTRPTSTDLQLNMEIRPGSEGPPTVWGECVQKTAWH